jgi:aspartyl/asparaginyl-tRNA synthetase
MKRERFAKLCLIASVIGLGIMYASTQFIQPSKVSPGEITRQDVGESYRVAGEVSNFYSTESTSFFELRGESEGIQVVDFQNRKFSTGQELLVTGEIDLYQGTLELVSTRIERR